VQGKFLAAANAKRDNPFLEAVALHRVKQSGREHRTGSADRMAMRYRAAFHIDDLRVQAEFFCDSNDNRRKGLIDLDPLDVPSGSASALECLLDCWHRTQSEHAGLDRRYALGDESCHRSDALLVGPTPTGPENWGGLDAADAACWAGGQQSPIDITASTSARQPPLRINWSKRPDTIVNNGHTIQFDFAEGDPLHIGDRRYALKQFHFHHPSEHLIEGKQFAMEVHFVHAGTNGLAVIGMLMVAGKPNAIFKKIVSTMPQEKGLPVPANPAIDPGELLPTQRAYYHYEGSLTTPPCSETVDWIVLAHPIEVDKDDIARFAKLYPMNARPVQNRNRRFILSSGPL
jgi:carbonic anhydrase